MRTVALPSGKTVKIAIHHTEREIEVMDGPYYTPPENRRVTIVEVIDDGVEYAQMSICRPPDNFSRLAGRRIAANKLLRQLKIEAGYHHEDRRAIFFFICPEYGATEASPLQKQEVANGDGAS